MAKSIKFIASGSSNALGNFAPDDIAHNVADDLAAHFVDECKCAVYLERAERTGVPVNAPATHVVVPATKPKKTKAEPAPAPDPAPAQQEAAQADILALESPQPAQG